MFSFNKKAIKRVGRFRRGLFLKYRSSLIRKNLMYYGNFKIMMLGMSVSTVCYVALHIGLF